MLAKTLLIASLVFTSSRAIPLEASSVVDPEPTITTDRYQRSVLTARAFGFGRGRSRGELIELVDIVLEITEEALGSNYSGTGSGTFVGGNFLSPTIVIDPNYQGPS
ncbi:hypothetical protein PG993_006708 [Apiospora rasikravindrae]|uniref:Uncharacterized protein n=1 Tax=Apiospora rasikravindrae TaxID=990691 RepID=A0ABR1T875_9PEZI